MRSIAFALAISLAACSGAESTFSVKDEHGLVTAARLELCGSEASLQRRNGQFTARKTVDCESSGRIRLTHASGAQHDCLIGYVTPGAEQDWTFRATGSGCLLSNP